MEMANLYHHYSDDPEADYAKAVEYVDFMKKIGATYMNLQAVMWRDKPYDRPLDEKTILAYAELSNRIGKLCRDNGLVACFHPHANTAIYKEEEIDLFVANTDPELVGFVLDTPHDLAHGRVQLLENMRCSLCHQDVDQIKKRCRWPMASSPWIRYVDFRGYKC